MPPVSLQEYRERCSDFVVILQNLGYTITDDMFNTSSKKFMPNLDTKQSTSRDRAWRDDSLMKENAVTDNCARPSTRASAENDGEKDKKRSPKRGKKRNSPRKSPRNKGKKRVVAGSPPQANIIRPEQEAATWHNRGRGKGGCGW